jgi:hypothetical protein
LLTAAVPAGAKSASLEMRTTPGHEAGAALAGPVRAIVGAGTIELGDWEGQGLQEYSGGVRYSRSIVVPDGGLSSVDLGRVRGTAEVFVDGVSVGARFCSPYRYPLADVVPGPHTLSVEVFNTAAPYLDAVSPTHFVSPGQKTSGLFGPVVLRAPSAEPAER